jgi:hypothetical protein
MDEPQFSTSDANAPTSEADAAAERPTTGDPEVDAALSRIDPTADLPTQAGALSELSDELTAILERGGRRPDGPPRPGPRP